jgi:thymidylate synthase
MKWSNIYVTDIVNKNEQVYLDLLRDVLENGQVRKDRTGVGTIGVFGRQCRYDLGTFPLMTTKKIDLRSVSSELLWFLEGSGDERRLAEIRYGKPRSELVGKKTIWTENLNAPYWEGRAKFEGDLGNIYGVMFRKWPSETGPVDQIANLINGLRNDPYGRRHIVSAWNPGELHNMALPPCHIQSQFYVQDGKLSCMLTQRSGDALLGIPYNVASYALLTHMIAQVCGLGVGELIHNIGDVHIYLNHVDQVREQLSRTPRAAPTIRLDPSIKNINDFTMDSFELIGYDPHPAIKAPMAV